MIEDLLKTLTATLAENNELLKQTIAGRTEALAALATAGATSETKPRARAASRAAEPAATAETKPAPAAVTKVAVSIEDLRKAAAGFLNAGADLSLEGGEANPANVEKRKAKANDHLRPMLNHFGVKLVTELAGEQAEQAMFYLARFSAGLPVDYSADYDFDADPLTQGIPAAAAADEDDMGV